MQSAPYRVGVIAVLSFLLIPNSAIWGQSPAPVPSAAVTIDFGNNQIVNATVLEAISDLIGLQPNQTVNISVQLPKKNAGHAITANLLDGGGIIGSNKLIVASDGTLTLRFQASAQVGISQVSLRDGAREVGIQFWVLDTLNPQNNPPAITPATPHPSS